MDTGGALVRLFESAAYHPMRRELAQHVGSIGVDRDAHVAVNAIVLTTNLIESIGMILTIYLH